MQFGKEYIKTFNTEADYLAFKATSGYNEPNVSYVVGDNVVHYNKYVDPYAGHAYVDLGLPSGTKWATMNVGASSESDYGNYYQYGKGSAQYAATSGDSDYSGEEDPLDSSVDTAKQVWGGDWHMPTQAQLNELTANTTYEWTTVNGVNGGLFTSNINGNSIFIPAAGYWFDGSHYNEGSSGCVWSSSPNVSYLGVFYLNFFDGGKTVDYRTYRFIGYSVRPVVG